MQEGDGETNYAYYALHQLQMMPWDFAALESKRKAALIAMIQEKVRSEKSMTKK